MLGILIAALFLAPPTEAQKKEAKAHFEQGRSFYDAGAYDDALHEYQAAHKLMPAPQFLFNIAQCYRLKGDKQNAIDYYQKFLEKMPDAAVSDEARDYVAKLKLQLELEAAEAARKKAEQEAAEVRRRADEEQRRRTEEDKLRKRSTQDEEEAIRRLQARMEEDKRRNAGEEQKQREKRIDEAQSAGNVTRIVGLSLLGATVITGIIFYSALSSNFDANDKIDRFNNTPGAPWTTELDQAAKDNNDTAPKVLLGMTIGMLVTGTVVYLVGVHLRSNAVDEARAWHLSVAPELSPHQAGLQVGWSF